jgi:hypothetical protein
MTRRPIKLVTIIAALAVIALAAEAMFFTPSEAAVKKPTITVYKDPSCGCCKNWIQYLVKHGYQVDAKDSPDMPGVKRSLGIPPALTSCHTAVVNGYLIEGHVSAEDIDRLLAQKPKIAGLAVPGMPGSSPGMDGPRTKPYQVLAFDKNGKTSVFSTH